MVNIRCFLFSVVYKFGTSRQKLTNRVFEILLHFSLVVLDNEFRLLPLRLRCQGPCALLHMGLLPRWGHMASFLWIFCLLPISAVKLSSLSKLECRTHLRSLLHTGQKFKRTTGVLHFLIYFQARSQLSAISFVNTVNTCDHKFNILKE